MKLAICVGHSRPGDNGAYSVGGVSEWDYHKVTAIHVQRFLTGLGISSSVVSHYEGRTYLGAMSWLAAHLKRIRCTHAIELHFNAADPTAHGAEWLHWHSSSGGLQLAMSQRAQFIKDFPEMRDRGLKPISSRSRGSAFLKKTHCPAVIAEPFFGSNDQDWQRFADRQEDLAESVAKGYAGLAGNVV